MEWRQLTDVQQLTDINAQSHHVPQLLFKHSTRCPISTAAKLRLEQKWRFDETEVVAYYLDLLQYRNISDVVAEKYSVYHESPQVILITSGECTYEASHLDISVAELHEAMTTE